MCIAAAVMTDDESVSDDIALYVPLPPKRRCTIAFSKCIICQADSKDKLRNGKHSSIVNLISKLEIRQDDVYERLSPYFSQLYENEVLWHASCYATYTSLQNMKYVSSASKQEGNLEEAEGTTASSIRSSRSNVAPHDWTKCLFCKNRTYKKERVMQNVSTFEACNTIMQCAEAKGDQDMLHILLGVNNDLVAAEGKYHKTCYASYVSKSNLKSRSFKEDEGKESAFDQAFCELGLDIRNGLELGRAYDMSFLLNKYAGLLEKLGVDGQKYTKQKLKLRLKAHFGESIVFHQPYQKTNPELVYSSSISLQDIINAAAAAQNAQPQNQETEPHNKPTEDPSPKHLLYKAAKLLKSSSVKAYRFVQLVSMI